MSDAIRDTFRPRFQWRPYIFRSYFDTQMLIAEAKKMIAHDFRVFFIGHKGSIEANTLRTRESFQEALIKEMRDAFKRSEQFLDLEGSAIDPLVKQRELVQTAIAKATPEQFGQMQEVLQKMGIGNIYSQASVTTSDDAARLISEGRRFVGTLPNGKVVLQR